MLKDRFGALVFKFFYFICSHYCPNITDTKDNSDAYHPPIMSLHQLCRGDDDQALIGWNITMEMGQVQLRVVQESVCDIWRRTAGASVSIH